MNKNMLHRISRICSICAATFAVPWILVSCDPTSKSVDVQSVSVDPSSVEMVEGTTYQLTPKVSPENATNKNVSWKSSNDAVVTVNGGTLSAISAGQASVTVTTEDGGKTASSSVIVIAKTIPVTSVGISKESLSLVEGELATLTATVSPSNASNKNVTWSSSNTSVASVSGGKITAVKAGTATITVTTEDGAKKATCAVTVKAKTIAVTGVSLDKTSVSLVEGESTTLTATVNPTNASNKNVSWSSSNSSVATVSGGKVTAVKAGTATITVTTEDGAKKATCTVTVKAKTIAVTGVSLDKTSVSLVEGETATLTATVNPSNASNKNVTWSSSNTSVATVSGGKITAVKAGTATITVTTEDGAKKATCTVTVKAKAIAVTGVSLDKTSVSLVEGESTTLSATVNPSNASNKNVTWSSSNTSVATVSGGKITAVKAGTATITVTTEDGAKKATCIVTVKAKTIAVTGVSLDKTSVSLVEGESTTLTATVNPSNASNKNVSWSSSNSSVATVSGGKITAVKAGTATITVTTEDGAKKATCTVTVNPKGPANGLDNGSGIIPPSAN